MPFPFNQYFNQFEVPKIIFHGQQIKGNWFRYEVFKKNEKFMRFIVQISIKI